MCSLSSAVSYERPCLPWSQSRIWSRGLCPRHAELAVINSSLAVCAAEHSKTSKRSCCFSLLVCKKVGGGVRNVCVCVCVIWGAGGFKVCAVGLFLPSCGLRLVMKPQDSVWTVNWMRANCLFACRHAGCVTWKLPQSSTFVPVSRGFALGVGLRGERHFAWALLSSSSVVLCGANTSCLVRWKRLEPKI